jgi:hypothetical protein
MPQAGAASLPPLLKHWRTGKVLRTSRPYMPRLNSYKRNPPLPVRKVTRLPDGFLYLMVKNNFGQAAEVHVSGSEKIPGSGIQIPKGGYHHFNDLDKRTGY